MKINFLNPFNGKPKPIPLNGLLLYDPSVLMSFIDVYMSRIFADAGHESLYKRLSAASKGEMPVDRALALIGEMTNAFGMPEEIWEELKISSDIEEQLLAGASINEVDLSKRIGTHRAAIRGAQLSDPDFVLDKRHTFLINVEKASFPIEWAMASKDIPLAVQRLKEDKLLSQFLWPEMNTALESITGHKHFLLLRASMSLEVLGHYLAVLEMHVEKKFGFPAMSTVRDIWPQSNSNKNPTALLFQWMKQHANMKSISSILNHPKLVAHNYEMTTLKRWSNGSHHPDRQRLDTLLDALFGDRDYIQFWVRHYMAKLINFIGYVHTSIASKIPHEMSVDDRKLVAPWPAFPHNHHDFATWGKTRYPIWREFAAEYQAELHRPH